jgi:ABC-type branched-subunit amino acid transport system ATPase component
MMCKPRLVLLDEPTAGVHPSVTHALGEYVLARNGEGVSFLIVEHNLNFVTSLCQHLVVLDHGRQIAQGTPSEVVAQQAVVDAYLGD